MIDPDDEDDEYAPEDEPDDPDAWRDCAEDKETVADETYDAHGFPLV